MKGKPMLSFKNICALSILLAGQLQANDWVELQKLTANDALGNSEFGSAVAMSADGTTLIVGGPSENNAQGATWIYQQKTDGWHQEGSRLVIPTEGKTNQGIAVAISGDGTKFAIGGCGDNNNMGAVWIFERKNNELPQIKSKLVGHNTNGTTIYQGKSIALSSDGKKLAIGGPGDSAQGAVWLYQYNGTEWQEGTKINSQDVSINANFGASVALSQDGSVLAIGAPNDGENGAVFTFKCTENTCIQDGTKLVPDDKSNELSSKIGYVVALSADGKTLAISAPYDSLVSGAVWIYMYTDEGKWVKQGTTLKLDVCCTRFGSGLALSQDGNLLLISNHRETTYKFYRKDGEWLQDSQKITAKDSGSALQGSSIALSSQGNIVALGGPAYNNNQGAVWIFGDPDNSQTNSKDYYFSYWVPPVAAIIAGLITFGLKHVIKKHCCITDDSALPTHIKLSDPLVMIETHRGSFA